MVLKIEDNNSPMPFSKEVPVSFLREDKDKGRAVFRAESGTCYYLPLVWGVDYKNIKSILVNFK